MNLTVTTIAKSLADYLAPCFPSVAFYEDPNQQGSIPPCMFLQTRYNYLTLETGGFWRRRMGLDLTYLEELEKLLTADQTPQQLLEASAQAAALANQAIQAEAERREECRNMGTTLVSAISYDGGVVVTNVGDSRAYRITKGGIRRITRDHSVVEDLVARGDLTPEQARSHPQKNLITRALGTSSRVKADLFQETVSPGDAILLCSDGLVNQVTDQEICQEIQAGGTAQEICQRLVTRTLDSGAPDNVTVVLFQL